VYKLNPYGGRPARRRRWWRSRPPHRDLAESICPWCISDGTAHEALGVLFADDFALTKAGVSEDIIREVVERTPGYETWQGEIWLSHCDDACAFLGNASRSDLERFEAEAAQVVDSGDWDAEGIRELLKYYEPKGSPSLYRFRCVHCGQILYAVDCD
jgi:uncharacterized protein CbrC (UPF0167 family)